MIIVTSLSPTHSCKDNQVTAIESWKRYGDCFSLNHEKEIPLLANYDIDIIPVKQSMHALTGKHLININTILDFAEDHDLLYLNSDIILKDLPNLRSDGVTIMSRYDYTHDINHSVLFPHGYDAFYIPAKFLNEFPPSIYALGASWHDYWLPKWCIKKGIPLYYPNGRFAFHKVHPVQYPLQEWYKLGEYFKLDFNFDKTLTVEKIAQRTIQEIRLSCRP